MNAAQASTNGDYTLRGLFFLYALAALPAAFLTWVMVPILSSFIPWPPALLFWLATLVGLLWQCAMAVFLLRRERAKGGYDSFRSRVWLAWPRDPRTGAKRLRSFFWILPAWLLGLLSLGLGVLLINPYALLLVAQRWLQINWTPTFFPPGFLHVTELASPEFAGAGWMVALAVVSWVLTAILGEELLFRGVLLPRMAGVFGKRDWAANALLYGLAHLDKPWMIPSRLVYGLLIAGPAKHYQSNLLAVAIHGVEGLALLCLVLIGVQSVQLAPLSSPLALPSIEGQPKPFVMWYRKLNAIPTYDPDSAAPGQVDLRGVDLSALDLTQEAVNLSFADFDAQTRWPAGDKLPAGFDPASILETGKNPGLGVRQLHAQGVTGRGVGVAIIDQPLLVEHQEYAQQLDWYQEIAASGVSLASTHGPAVSSLVVGKTVGVAPEARLYYFGISSGLRTMFMQYHDFAQAIRRVLQINRGLPAASRIRVISISLGFDRFIPGYADVMAAIDEARNQGVFVIPTTLALTEGLQFEALNRAPTADPELAASYTPGLFTSRNLAKADMSRILFVPMDSRTTAAPSAASEYVFYRVGGFSWAVPYLAGTYALACQVDPDITPARFWQAALQTASVVNVEYRGQNVAMRVVNPTALVQALQSK